MVGLLAKKLGHLCVATLAVLALSGCKTTSGSWDTKVENIKQAIEESLIDEDWSVGVQIIRRSKNSVISELGPWLEDRAHTFPPVYLYAMSDRLYKDDAEWATRWYVAARTRHLYDLLRCTDRSAQDRIDVFARRFRKTVFKFIRENPDKAHEMGQRALEWDRENPIHRTSPMKECMLGAQGSAQSSMQRSIRNKGYSPFSDIYYPAAVRVNESDWVKPVWLHPEMLDQARRMSARFVESLQWDDDAWEKKMSKSKFKSSADDKQWWRDEKPNISSPSDKPWRRKSKSGHGPNAGSGKKWVPMTQ